MYDEDKTKRKLEDGAVGASNRYQKNLKSMSMFFRG
jgi:hypothetical protein